MWQVQGRKIQSNIRLSVATAAVAEQQPTSTATAAATAVVTASATEAATEVATAQSLPLVAMDLVAF